MGIWYKTEGFKDTDCHAQADHLQWLFTFLSGAIDAMIRNWVKNGMKESPEELSQLAGKMCSASMERIFKGSD